LHLKLHSVSRVAFGAPANRRALARFLDKKFVNDS